MWNMQGIFRSFNNMDEICGQYRTLGRKKPAGNPVSLAYLRNGIVIVLYE